MTGKTLILGTSHVGALHSAAQDLPPAIRASFDFLAVPVYAAKDPGYLPDGAYGLRDTSAVPERLLQDLMRMNGRLSRTLSDYARIVHVGQDPGHPALLGMMAGYGVQGLRKGGASTRSRAAFRAFAASIVAAKVPEDMLRDVSGHKLAIVQLPLRNEAILHDPEAKESRVWPALLAAPEGLRDLMLAARPEMRRVYAERGVELILQPDVTIGDFALTRSEYGRGGVSLRPRAGAKDARDHAHMNADYGRLILNQILAWADVGTVDRAAA